MIILTWRVKTSDQYRNVFNFSKWFEERICPCSNKSIPTGYRSVYIPMSQWNYEGILDYKIVFVMNLQSSLRSPRSFERPDCISSDYHFFLRTLFKIIFRRHFMTLRNNLLRSLSDTVGLFFLNSWRRKFLPFPRKSYSHFNSKTLRDSLSNIMTILSL